MFRRRIVPAVARIPHINTERNLSLVGSAAG